MGRTANVDAVYELIAHGAVDRLERVLCGVGDGLLEVDAGGEGGARGRGREGAGDLEGRETTGGGFGEEGHDGVCDVFVWCLVGMKLDDQLMVGTSSS
jgi:hypothetical protein